MSLSSLSSADDHRSVSDRPPSDHPDSLPRGVFRTGVPRREVATGGVPHGEVPRGGVPRGEVATGGVPRGEVPSW